MRRTVLLTLALSLAACGVESAAGAVMPPARVNVARAASCAADSLCYVLAWPAAADANGAADAYHVRIATSAGFTHDDTVTTTSLRFAIPKPAPGASVSITAQVWSIRRGLQSASAASATATAHTVDVPPPAPSSVTITPDSALAMVRIIGPDTIPRDSVVAYALAAPAGLPGVQAIAWWVEPGGGSVFATPTRLAFGEIGQHGLVAAWLAPGDSLTLVLGLITDAPPWPRVSKVIRVS